MDETPPSLPRRDKPGVKMCMPSTLGAFYQDYNRRRYTEYSKHGSFYLSPPKYYKKTFWLLLAVLLWHYNYYFFF